MTKDKSRLEIGKVVGSWGSELPPKQERINQVVVEDEVRLIYRRIFTMFLLRIASVSDTE